MNTLAHIVQADVFPILVIATLVGLGGFAAGMLTAARLLPDEDH